jgi:ABC-type glycerol-3-phosphate transport system substrate-binding protein
MFSQTVLRLIGVVAIITLLVACQRNDSNQTPDSTATPQTATEPPPNDNRTLVRLAVSSGEKAIFDTIVADFEEQYDDIDVQLVDTDAIVVGETENYARVLASSADVIPAFANREINPQFLRDLTPLIESDPDFDRADFLPNLLIADGDKLHTLPAQVGYQLIYYDKAAFDAAGIPYPTADWTLDTFLQTAQQLTMREGNTVTQWGYVPFSIRSNPLIEGLLAAPVGAQGDPRYDEPDVIAALDWFAALHTEHGVMPPLNLFADDAETPTALISAGQAAMWSNSSVSYDDHLRSVPQLGVVNAPVTTDGIPAAPFIIGYGISNGSQSPEAAWQLVRYLSTQQQATGFASLLVPTRLSLLEAVDYWEQLAADLRPVLRHVAENMAPPRLWHAGQTEDVLAQALRQVIENETSAALALTGQEPAVSVDADEPVTLATPIPETPDRLTIDFVSGFGGIDLAHRGLAEEFERTHDDIKVNVTVPPMIFDRYDPLAEIASADCFLDSNSDLEAIRDVIIPLDPLFDADALITPGDFYPAALEPYQRDGQLYGLPASVSPSLIVYDRDVFAAAGVAEPQPGWTLSDFLATAQALTQGVDDEKVYGFGDQDLGAVSAWGTGQFAVTLLDEMQDPPEVNFQALAPLYRWYNDLINLYGMQPVIKPVPELYDYEHFVAQAELLTRLSRENRLAMWLARVFTSSMTDDFFFKLPAPDEMAQRNLGVATPPIGPSGYTHGSLWGAGYFIKRDLDAPVRTACWEWLRFLSEHDAAVDTVPARRDVLLSAEFADRVGAEVVAALDSILETSWPGAEIWPTWLESVGWLRAEAFAKIVNGADVEEALADTQRQFDGFRQCVIAEDGFDDKDVMHRCALEHIPHVAFNY